MIKELQSFDYKVPNKIRYNKHIHRKNNDIVAAMYAMYEMGKSLEEIGKVYRKTRQAVYDQFRSRAYPLRSKKLEGLTMIDGIRFTLMKGYLRGTVNGKRMLASRYVWEKHHGPVPAECVLKFRDGNAMNVVIENLEVVAFSDMQKMFNPNGNNQFTKKVSAPSAVNI